MPEPIPPVNPEDEQYQVTQIVGRSIDLQQLAANSAFVQTTGASSDLSQTAFLVNERYDEAASNYIPSFVYTATGSVTEVPCVVLLDATAGNIVLTIPSPSAAEGRTMTLQRLDATANTVTITPADGNVRITASALAKLGTQYGVVDLTAVTNGSYLIWVGR